MNSTAAAAPDATLDNSVLDTEPVSENRRSATVNASSSTRTDPSPPSLLIAEDHADSREALRVLLEASGYRVMLASNGREAIDAGVLHQPDLVLMDIMMPEVDGFEATRALRASSEFRQVPILAITAMEGARDLALAAGCDDYIPKPIDVRTFLSTIGRWIETGRPAGS